MAAKLSLTDRMNTNQRLYKGNGDKKSEGLAGWLLLTIGISLTVLSGCYWGHPLAMPDTHQNAPVLVNIDSPLDVLVAPLQEDIRIGEAVFAFPSFGLKSRGFLCNTSRASNPVETFQGADQHLGDWVSTSAKAIVNALKTVAIKADNGLQSELDESTHDLVLVGTIRHLRGNFCQQHVGWLARPTNTYSGEMYLELDWRWVCPSNWIGGDDIVRHAVTTRTSAIQVDPWLDGIAVLFDRLVKLSIRQLLADQPTRHMLAVSEGKADCH